LFDLFKTVALMLAGVAFFAIAAHYALEAIACYRVIRTRRPIVRETEFDEWLLVFGLVLASPFVIFSLVQGAFLLATDLYRGLVPVSVGLLALGQLVIFGRRRWLQTPSLILYGFSGSAVGKHIEDGMALEWAVYRQMNDDGSRTARKVTAAFPGLRIQDGGALGLTIIRGKGNWRGLSNLKSALLKRAIQTNLLCSQTLKADFVGLWVTAMFSIACAIVIMFGFAWFVYFFALQPR